MMDVGVVGVAVHEGLVDVLVSVRFADRVARAVGVPVVCIVYMPVRVDQPLVRVLVRVAFR